MTHPSPGTGRSARGLATLAAVLLLAGSLTSANESPQQQLEAIESDLERVESWLQSSRRDRDTLQEDLRRADLAIADLAARARLTQRELDTQTRLAAELASDIEALSASEERARAVVHATARQAWLMSRRGPLQLLLEAESPERIARLLAYHEHLARSRAEAIEGYRRSQRQLEARREELDTTRRRLQQEQQTLDTQVAQLEGARRGQTTALQRLERDIDAREARRSELLRSQARLQELLERLARQAVEVQGETFAANRGSLPWPVDGRLLTGEDTGRDSAQRRSGVLLAASAGSTVQAIHPGRVVFADWMRGLGLLVILDHGGGYMSLYGQAESLLRNVGDMVEAGEPLATAGRSGGSSESGVWFEIRHNGKPEDPKRWCRPPRGA